MEKSVLNLFLRKLAKGDPSCREKLALRLANRLVYVPAEPTERGDVVTFAARTIIDDAGRKLVPMFTTKESFLEWTKAKGFGDESLTLLGGDFCDAVDTDTLVLVDPESDHEAVLDAEMIDEVALAPIDHDETEAAPPSGEPSAVDETTDGHETDAESAPSHEEEHVTPSTGLLKAFTASTHKVNWQPRSLDFTFEAREEAASEGEASLPEEEPLVDVSPFVSPAHETHREEPAEEDVHILLKPSPNPFKMSWDEQQSGEAATTAVAPQLSPQVPSEEEASVTAQVQSPVVAAALQRWDDDDGRGIRKPNEVGGAAFGKAPSFSAAPSVPTMSRESASVTTVKPLFEASGSTVTNFRRSASSVILSSAGGGGALPKGGQGEGGEGKKKSFLNFLKSAKV